MGQNVQVSVIVPVYNGEKYLQQCLDSILCQKNCDFEAIFVDDGSTDSSCEIIESYMRTDSRIKLFRIEKQNAGTARNYGIEMARGNYYLFVDCDDFIESRTISKMLEECLRTRCDVCLCDADDYSELSKEFIYTRNRYLRRYHIPGNVPFSLKDISDSIFQVSTSVPWAKMFRADFIKEKGIRFQSLARNNDIFFVDMSLASADRISYVSDTLIHHRIGLKTNLQSKHYETPTILEIVLRKLSSELKKENLYNKAEKSYISLVIADCRHVFERLKDHEDASIAFTETCREMLGELGIYNSLKIRGNELMAVNMETNMDEILLFVLDLFSLKKMNMFHDTIENVYRKLSEVLKEKYRELLLQLPFDQKQCKVGIYGTGKHTEGLIRAYRKLIGDIHAELIFVESEKCKNEYMGCERISYKEMDGVIDIVIISSYIYNDEMVENALKVLPKDKVLSFYPKCKQDIFAGFGEKKDLEKILGME